MSADFFSDIKVGPKGRCERWDREFAERQVRGDIAGPDERTLFRFEDDGDRPDLAKLATAYAGKPAPSELGPTYVALEHDLWTEYMDERLPGASHMSSNYASLVAIDRAVAIPRGVHLLGGHAVRRVKHDELAEFVRDWRFLMMATGGAKAIAATCGAWMDRGYFDVDELADFVDEIGELAEAAIRLDAELLLVGYPAP